VLVLWLGFVLWLRLWLCSERNKVRTLASGRARTCMNTRARVRDMIWLLVDLGVGLILVLD
jgi:hypothetical protein